MPEITWKQDAQKMLDVLKKMTILTKTNTVYATLSNNELYLKSGYNQHLVSWKLPVSYEGETINFGFKSDPIKVFIGTKQEVTFVYDSDNSILKFKSNRSRGELQTIPWDDFEVVANDTKPIDKVLQDAIFDNFNRLNFLGTGFTDTSVLKVKAHEGLLTLQVAEDLYVGVVKKKVDCQDDLSMDIALCYADIMVNSFTREDKVEISVSPNLVCLVSKQGTIVLPRIAENAVISIEQIEDFYATNVTKETLTTAVIFPNKSELLPYVKEMKDFFNTASKEGKITFIVEKTPEGDKTTLRTIIPEGKMFTDIEKCKIQGGTTFTTCFIPLIFALANIDDGVIKIALYNNMILIKSSADPESYYILFNQVENS